MDDGSKANVEEAGEEAQTDTMAPAASQEEDTTQERPLEGCADQPCAVAEDAGATADEEGAAAEMPASLAPLESQLRDLQDLTQSIAQRVAAIEEAVREVADRVSYIPPQVVALGRKVEALNTSVSEPRYRELLLRLLQLYDQAQHALQSMRTQAETGLEVNHERNYEALAAQVLYILSLNGIEPIPETEEFDPTLHEAMLVEPVSDPEQVGKILRTPQPGFRTTHGDVLRYAKVVTGAAPVQSQPKPASDEEGEMGIATHDELTVTPGPGCPADDGSSGPL